MNRPTLFLLSCAALVGCANTPSDAVEPTLAGGGKGDSLSSVTNRGVLEFGGAVTGEFAEDLTFDGYTFSATEGAELTLEVTQAGSSRGLDTTLFLFGSTDGGSWARLGFDDDAGWGALSKIEGLTVDAHERFMAVVGTHDGGGRGNYRLELRCQSDVCIGEAPVELDGCSDVAYELFEHCVEETLEESDFSWDDPAEEISIDYCSNDGAHEYHYYLCDDSISHEFCQLSSDAIDGVAEACGARLRDDYGVEARAALEELPPGPTLGRARDRLLDAGAHGSRYDLAAYEVSGASDARSVAVAVRFSLEFGEVLSIGRTLSGSEFLAALDDEALVAASETIAAEHDSAFEAVELHGSRYAAAGVEEWVVIRVLYFPSDATAYALSTFVVE